jgi:hypothetical protein
MLYNRRQARQSPSVIHIFQLTARPKCTAKTFRKDFHVSGVQWRIITGYGLDDWIYWHLYYNYNLLSQFIISDRLRVAQFLTRLSSFLSVKNYERRIPGRSIERTLLIVLQLRGEPNISYNVLEFLCYSGFLFLFVATETCLPKYCPAMDYSVSIRCSWNILGESLASN